MNRTLALIYGFGAYALFIAASVYLVAFVGDFGFARTIESGTSPLPGNAIALDLALLALLGVQQIAFARRGFWRRCERFVPRPIERSTCVLTSALSLGLLYLLWSPIPTPIWTVHEPVARIALVTAFWTGWALVLVASFLVDHLELFGLRHVLAHARGEWIPRQSSQASPLLSAARYPAILGLLLASWSAPEMSAGRLLFAAGVTAWSLIAIQVEEREYLLAAEHPARRN